MFQYIAESTWRYSQLSPKLCFENSLGIHFHCKNFWSQNTHTNKAQYDRKSEGEGPRFPDASAKRWFSFVPSLYQCERQNLHLYLSQPTGYTHILAYVIISQLYNFKSLNVLTGDLKLKGRRKNYHTYFCETAGNCYPQ